MHRLLLLLSLPALLLAQNQTPIRYVIDCHADPIPNGITAADRLAMASLWATNTTWLLDTLEPVGARVSFLSGGTWAEQATLGGVNGPCAVLLRRIATLHGQIGCHAHNEQQAGANNWPQILGTPTYAQCLDAWTDNFNAVQAAINMAFSVLPLPEPMASLMSVRNSHVPSNGAQFATLMQGFSHHYRQGGTEEDYYGWYEHHIWNPYRPDATNVMNEDLSAPYIVIPQGSMLGVSAIHHGVLQDMTGPAVRKQFLQLYLNWRFRDRTGAPSRVWSWGYGSHPTEYDATDPTRIELPAWLAWLQTHFVTRVEPTGSQVFQFSTQESVGAALEAWETSHPGIESFGGHALAVNWSEYPYLRAVAEEFHGFQWFADLALPGVNAFHLKRGALDGVLLWRDAGTGVVDISASAGPLVRVVNLETGQLLGTNAASVTVGTAPILVTEMVTRTVLSGMPALGASIALRVTAPANTPALLAVALAPANIPIPHMGALLLDPATLTLLASGNTGVTGSFVVPLTIPAVAALSGITFHVQGASLDFSGASLKLATNAVQVAIP